MKKILISMVIITIGIGGMLSMSRSANAAIIDYTETTTETSTVAANEDTSVQNGKSESTESQTTENDTLNRIIELRQLYCGGNLYIKLSDKIWEN